MSIRSQANSSGIDARALFTILPADSQAYRSGTDSPASRFRKA
jgi:hypothetical protein